MTEYRPRDIGALLLQALKDIPVVVVTGMRQTGKTTLLQRQPGLSGRRYVSFDDFAQLEAAKGDPEGFIRGKEPITIDEAQKCPEILPAIKKAVDKERIPGKFLLSGSANFALIKGISESLAGRAVYFVLHPFNRREIAGSTKAKPFVRTFFEKQALPRSTEYPPVTPTDILSGGMPSVCLGEIGNRSLWFKGYEQTYLERDVREISDVGNIIAFRNMLRLVALRTGQLLSPSDLGRDAKLSAATASRYLGVLEASFVMYRLSPYLRNRASRLIKSPKIYLGDCGLASYLAGFQEAALTPGEPIFGAMLETYAAQNLLGILDATWPDANLYFWNVQGRHEVDFVVEAGADCLAIEVKSGVRWQDRDLAGLRAFLTATPHCRAAILAYGGSEAVRLGERLWAMPLSLVIS
jgi:uncharacterized protein